MGKWLIIELLNFGLWDKGLWDIFGKVYRFIW
jgi:hypothetical protein